ncbi:DUF2071 domain-containing protein [Nocardioides sp. C4-1]|uniref:YqjF family protein n=1 Tax=Nocardioides sp. C4-1 TaxID=3151851 RepID=UPI0032639C95
MRRTAPVEPVDQTAPPLTGSVLMSQQWRDLTFLHWAVSPDRVAHLMPPHVAPDVTDDGLTYVGLIPFRMVDAGPGRHRPVPWLGSFCETNVRLYSVDRAGRRGVVFVSLDCERLMVVAGARACFAVPYRWARMTHVRTTGPAAASSGPAGEHHTYRSRVLGRSGLGRPSTEVSIRVESPRTPTELDLFVSARWRLHTHLLGRTLEVPNEHEPWPLHDAEVLHLRAGLLEETGFADLAGRRPDHVAFSPGVHTSFGWPRAAGHPRTG